MALLDTGQVIQYVVGETRPRRVIVGAVLGMLGLASGAFLLGLDVGLGDFAGGWLLVALGIALIAGLRRAGLGPTVGALWLIALWLFVFPPLVGYLTGEWAMASRYTHPRMMGFGYTSARAELIGGLEYGLQFGLFFAVVPGTMAYVVGSLINRFWNRFEPV
ncbi:MAG: hypothetical protein ABEI52_01035 [Halobacteriaceae archaeon]